METTFYIHEFRFVIRCSLKSNEGGIVNLMLALTQRKIKLTFNT